jgi:hypothetical protein
MNIDFYSGGIGLFISAIIFNPGTDFEFAVKAKAVHRFD